MKTIICDIDGTLVRYLKNHIGIITEGHIPLPGVVKKMNEWENMGHRIILITGRRENLRETTQKELTRLGIPFDVLLMGYADSGRVLINDELTKRKAHSVSLKRNEGFENFDWRSVELST